MRIALVTTAWNRPAITSIAFGYYSRFTSKTIDLVCYVAISPDDRYHDQLSLIARHFGFRITVIENQPLFAKWNAVLQAAAACNPDAILITGSDDLVTEKLLVRSWRKLRKGYDFVEPEDAYFYHIIKRRLIHRHLNQNGTRLFSREAIDEMSWELWDPSPHALAMDKAMDLHIGDKLVRYRLPPKEGYLVLGLKGDGSSRVPFWKYERNLKGTTKNHLDFFARYFTREYAEICRIVGAQGVADG